MAGGHARARPDRLREDGRDARRHDHRHPRAHRGRHGRVLPAAHAVHPELRGVRDERLLQDPERPDRHRRRVHEQDRDRRRARRRAARGDAPDRGADRPARGRARDGPGRDPAEELHPEGGLPGRGGDGRGVRLGRLPRLARQAAREPRPRRLPGASRRSCASRACYRGIGFSTYVEICGLAPSRAVGPSGVGIQAGFWESAVVRVHPSGTATVFTGASPHGQGHETGFAQIVADRIGATPDQVRGHPRRHRRRARSAWARTARARWPSAASPPRAPRTRWPDKARKIAAHLLEAAPGGHRAEGRQVPGAAARRTRALRSATSRWPRTCRRTCRTAWSRASRRRASTTPRTSCGRSARTRRSWTWTRRPARSSLDPLRVRRRLRPRDQPDADRRPGARRRRAGRRAGAVRAGRLRREGPARDADVRRLRAAHRGRDAVVRDRPHRDAVARQLAGREGRGRGGHDRRVADDRQRRDRCAAPARRRLHRHAAHAAAGVAGDRGGGRARLRAARDRAGQPIPGSAEADPPGPVPPDTKEVRSDSRRHSTTWRPSRSTTRSVRCPTAARTPRRWPAGTRSSR